MIIAIGSILQDNRNQTGTKRTTMAREYPRSDPPQQFHVLDGQP